MPTSAGPSSTHLRQLGDTARELGITVALETHKGPTQNAGRHARADGRGRPSPRPAQFRYRRTSSITTRGSTWPTSSSRSSIWSATFTSRTVVAVRGLVLPGRRRRRQRRLHAGSARSSTASASAVRTRSRSKGSAASPSRPSKSVRSGSREASAIFARAATWTIETTNHQGE